MARKKYESPEMKVSSFHCDDVLTSSGEPAYYSFDDGEGTIGSFRGSWIQ